MSVVIETTLGDVTVDLFIEERPQTCLNFLKLCKIKYYNLCLFHSVSSNFLAQTGDPTGKGDGGESIFGLLKGNQHRLYLGEKIPKIKHDRTGLLSMVSHGDGMLGSQFIITLSGNLTSLDHEHCVFGHVVEGVDLLLKLNEAITDDQHRPYQDIRITHTVILEDPFPDPEGLSVPPDSPVPPNTKDLAYSRIPADEPLSENYSQEELDEMVQQREAAARAAILEMVGDIPDADIAPPENVLFVCKLNPVTSDHDLSIIFSRFGTVKSCEVIRDQITGDSLQYAFIEFEDRKACEDAYFKMDNVLIDDRRIHVDFSQSVAKLKWKGKGRGVEHFGPPPPGGWGNMNKNNNSRGSVENNVRSNNYRKFGNSDSHNDVHRSSFRNGRVFKEENDFHLNKRRKINDSEKGKTFKKKEKVVKRRKSSSSSSSSDSVTESSVSSSYSSSCSSDAKRKRRKRSRKVLVVVKTPSGRSGSRKKSKKSRGKSKKDFDSDSDSDGSESVKRKRRKRKKQKKATSDSTSDEEDSSEDETARRKKKRKATTSSSSEKELSRTKKKKKKISETSESSTEYEVEHSSLNKKKTRNRRKRSYSSSDSDRIKVNRIKRSKVKEKKKQLKKNKKRR